jgi:hypothetical protein
MDLNLNKGADILINAMQIHSKNEVDRNAIKSMHRQGYIKTVLGNNLYTVVIDEEDYTIEARDGLNLSVNDIVIIMLYNGDISRSWIIDKKPKRWK